MNSNSPKPGLGDHPVVVLITVTVGLIGIISFFCNVQNSAELFSRFLPFFSPDNGETAPDSLLAEDTPTPTSRPLTRAYAYISLKNWSEHDSEETNLGLSPGEHVLAEVPFDTGWTSTTECQHLPNKSEVFEISLVDGIPNSVAVHLLIQAGNAFTRYEGNQIGLITLEFSDGHKEETRLILGYNIRDWAWGNNRAVTTTSSTNIEAAWEGKSSQGESGGMDVLSIPVESEQLGALLIKITLADLSRSNNDDINPCIHLLALTAEYLR